MKVPEIAKQFGLVTEEFEMFVDSTKPKGYKYGFVSDSIDDSVDINAIVTAFHEYKAGKKGRTIADVPAKKDRLEKGETSNLSYYRVGTEEANSRDAKNQTRSISDSDVNYLSKIDFTLSKIEGHVRFLKNVVIVYLVLFGLMLLFAFTASIFS